MPKIVKKTVNHVKSVFAVTDGVNHMVTKNAMKKDASLARHLGKQFQYYGRNMTHQVSK